MAEESSGLVFTPVTFEDKDLFRQILSECEIYKDLPASEITFESVFCWSACDHAQRCVTEEGIVIFYEYYNGLKAFYPPLVKKPEYFVPTLRKMMLFAKEQGFPFYVERLTKNMTELAAELENEGFCFEFKRDESEYLYNPADLINLAGKNYKSKRSLVHAFEDEYDYEFTEFEPEMKEEILALATECGKNPDSHDFQCELVSIDRALDYLDKLNMFCDVIKVEEEIVAFEIGFINHANVGIVLFEKGDFSYKGVYQAINNFFSEKHFANTALVNRQEDLGIDGLRESKSSYHPCGFSEKYTLTKKEN